MKRLFPVLLLLGGCCSDPSPPDYKVKLLFEQDGYKVYRFQDGYGSYHYFVVGGIGSVDGCRSTGKTVIREHVPTLEVKEESK